MKITIFIGGLSGGGAERVVCNLSNYLSSNRHEVTILTMSEDIPAYELSSNVQRIPLLRKNEFGNSVVKNIKRIIRFKKYLKNSQADIYLVMLPTTINMMLFFRKLVKVPIIVSERCDPITRYDTSLLRKKIMEKLYPRADEFVFQTEDARDYYKNIIGTKGIVIPNAINSEFIRETYQGNRKKKIVSAGRLTEQKNFTLLIDAFAKLCDRYPEYELIIYGDGPQKKDLIEYVKKLNMHNKVKFSGYVNDFGSHIIDASLFVLPSNYEGMPNALMEAMALGLPCISTDCPAGGPKFLIQDGINGLLVPVNDIENLVNKIDMVLSNTELSSKLGNNAKKIINRLDKDKIYNEWEKMLVRMINKKIFN